MAARGHDVDVIYSADEPITTTALPYKAHFVRHHERLYVNPLEFARLIWRKKLATEIVHVHGYEGAFHRQFARGRATVIATSHHPDPRILLDCPGYSNLIRRARWVRSRIIALLERRALRSADLVITTSAFGSSALRERGYLEQGTRIKVVHNGAPSLPSVQMPVPGVELVCVARLDQHKGIDVLIRAISLLKSPRPRLDLLGTGQEGVKLRELVQSLNLEREVRFRGFQDRARVAAYLAGATAFVLPSRSENFPLVILEAMQAGVPIVATRVGGIPEALRDGKEGILVSPDNAAELANALERVLRDNELRRCLATAARSRGKSFTWDRAAEEYERVYASVCA